LLIFFYKLQTFLGHFVHVFYDLKKFLISLAYEAKNPDRRTRSNQERTVLVKEL
jgi:hypothetical protein